MLSSPRSYNDLVKSGLVLKNGGDFYVRCMGFKAYKLSRLAMPLAIKTAASFKITGDAVTLAGSQDRKVTTRWVPALPRSRCS